VSFRYKHGDQKTDFSLKLKYSCWSRSKQQSVPYDVKGRDSR